MIPRFRVHTPLLVTVAIAVLVSIAAGVAAQTGRVDLERLDAYFAHALTQWNVPGMAIAIVKSDKVVLAKGYGVREFGKGDRVDEDTLFAIASNTKPSPLRWLRGWSTRGSSRGTIPLSLICLTSVSTIRT
jgi:CubicO group peptidase (beta-lactamase class C family)